MRVRIEATEEEFLSKSEELAEQIHELAHEIAPRQALIKAAQDKEPTLRYPVLKDLHKQTTALYQDHVKAMLEQVGKVLDRSVPETKKK